MLNVEIDGNSYKLATKPSLELVAGRGTYGNGSIDWGKEGLSLAEIAHLTGKAASLAAEINGQCLPLTQLITDDCKIRFITENDIEGEQLIYRTGIYLLAYGTAISHNGYIRKGGGIKEKEIYYDFIIDKYTPSKINLSLIEETINEVLCSEKRILPKKYPFYDAVELFTRQQEWWILKQIQNRDDGGPVSLQMLDTFAEIDSGFMLYELKKMKNVKPLYVDYAEKVCRVYGEILL